MSGREHVRVVSGCEFCVHCGSRLLWDDQLEHREGCPLGFRPLREQERVRPERCSDLLAASCSRSGR
jgi:hypothetical protein